MASFLYEILYVIPILCGSVAVFSPIAGLGEAKFIYFLAAGVMCALLIAFKQTSWLGRLVISGSLIAAGVFILLLGRNDKVYEILMELIPYLWLAVMGAAAFAAGEIIAYVRPVRIVVSFAALGIMAASLRFSIVITKPATVSGFTVILFTVVSEIQRRWDKAGDTDGIRHLVYTSPFLILSVVLVYISPAPEKAYDWTLAKKVYHIAYDKIQELDFKFSLNKQYDPVSSQMGFSERGYISGNTEKKDEEVMALSGISQWTKTVKLSGRNFSEFDGKRWLDSEAKEDFDPGIDTVIMLASLDEYTDYPGDYIKKTAVTIRYKRMNTDYAFIPAKSLTDDLRSDKYDIKAIGDDLIWPSVKPFSTQYEVPYYRLNTDNDKFKEYLINARFPSRELIEKYAALLPDRGGNANAYDQVKRYRDHIYDTYLSHVSMSDELREQMEEVYSGAESIPDKMDLLEAYLHGFEYSNSPGELPEQIADEGDFLDYFMRDSRKGFCSHFATAFVLLARAENIPARYVQGYAVPSGGASEAAVRSSMAHAWPEVYYEGAGWIPYEPTPGYEIRSYWKTREEWNEMNEQAAGSYPGSEEQTDEEEQEETEDETEAGKKVQIPWLSIIMAPITGLLFVMLVFAIRRAILRHRERGMDNRERFITLCRQNLFLLELLDIRMNEAETLNEYRLRIAMDMGGENTVFLDILGGCLYGEHAISDSDISKALDNRQYLYELMKSKHPFRILKYMVRW